jgi:hypothetical protein
MDFTFARATSGRAAFAVFVAPDEPVRRDQRDAARLRHSGILVTSRQGGLDLGTVARATILFYGSSRLRSGL